MKASIIGSREARLTCKLVLSLKNKKPRTRTRMVFMWPRTWKVTAEKRPMQMNWLAFTPTATMQDKKTKNCSKGKLERWWSAPHKTCCFEGCELMSLPKSFCTAAKEKLHSSSQGFDKLISASWTVTTFASSQLRILHDCATSTDC